MKTDRDRAAAARHHDIDLMFGGEPSPAPARPARIDPGPFERIPFERVHHWVVERDSVRTRREAGAPKPWTTDPALRDNRFCQVFRQHDRTSIYITNVWHGDDEMLASPQQVVANAVLGRSINDIDVLEELRAAGANREFDAEIVRRILQGREERGLGVVGGAYIVSPVVGMPKKFDSIPYQAAIAFREGARILNRASMRRTTEALVAAIRGYGPFMAGQVVADLRWVVRGPWGDRDNWAPMGKGSRRGLAWLLGWDGSDEDVAKRLVKESNFLPLLQQFQAQLEANPATAEVLRGVGAEMIDVQSILCETDKYHRLVLGTGRSKRKYPGRP